MRNIFAALPCVRQAFLLLLAALPGICQAQAQADFFMDRSGGCSPLTVAFTNTATGASANAVFKWDLGNGNISYLRNPSAIYREEKMYRVTLTVTDGTQTSNKTKMVTVYKKPVADFSAVAPKVCLPASAQFTSNATPGDGNITGYRWDFGDGTTQQGFGNGISHHYTYEQIPAVSLMVTNSYGCQASITKQNTVEILPPIKPLFTSDKTLLCSLNESIQLTNNSTGPGTLSYLWDFGDGTTSTLKNPAHRFVQKGLYSVRLTVSNTVGCSVTGNSLSINAAYFNTSFTARPLCREVSFTSSSYLSPTATLWKFGDGSTSNSFYTASHVYAVGGTYNVTLINTYGACKDTIVRPVTVQELVAFNSDITMPPSVCQGSSTTFTSTSSVPPGRVTWDFGDGAIFNTSFPAASHSYSQPGTYIVKMVNTFGTCSETVSKTINVHALPTPVGFIANYGGICGSPVTVQFSDTTQGATGWQWYLDYQFNPPFSTQQNASLSFTSDGFHTVYLTVTNANGCKKTVSKIVNIVSPSALIYYTYSSSPRGYYDCDSLTIKFAVNSNQPIQTYSWNFGNGLTSVLPAPQVSFNQQGIYPVTLTYITESGCTRTTSYEARVYGKPAANFSYNIPCGNSLNLQFSDNSYFSDGWNWTFGDGGSDYGLASPRHNYNDTGKYNVTFISRIGHCADTIVKPVYANILPSSINIIKAETTCAGTRGTVTFDHRSLRASGGTWSFGDGTIISYDTGAHNITHTYTATGTYNVLLTSFYGNCTLTSNRTVHVLLKQAPTLTTSNNTIICSNNQLNIQVANLVTNPYSGSYSWGQYNITNFQSTNGTPVSSSLTNATWQYTVYTATMQNFAPGIYSMRAIVGNPYNLCVDTTNYINLQVNGPQAGFKIQTNNLCFKTPFVFTDTSKSVTATPLTSWHWNFGDGTTQTNSTNATVAHTYTNPGNYNVSLTVTDALGCSVTTIRTARARGPKASFAASGLYIPNVPLNTSVTFYNYTNSSYTNSVNYTWHYGNGATSTNHTGQHTYTQAGVYTILLIASDPTLPACPDTARTTITVKDFNTAFSFTSSFLGSSSCPPLMVRITNLSVGFNRLLWDFGDGTTSANQYYPTHMYNTPGRYRITLYTYGFNGLTGTYIDSIEVKSPSATIAANALSGCTSKTIALTATTQNAATYTWDFGDGVVASGQTPVTHAYLSAGLYNPRLIVKDVNGCPASTQLSDSIVIDSLHIAIKGIPPLVCDSALIQFNPDVESFAATNLGTPLLYKWNFGTGMAGDTSNTRNPSFRYNLPGTYTVRFSVRSPYGCIKETSATIVVNQKAVGAITALPEGCEGTGIQFTGAASPTGNLQWAWTFGNGAISSLQTPPAQVYTPGSYVVSMTVNKNGCMHTSLHNLTVHPKPVTNATPQQAVVCLGNSVALSANGGGSYVWSPAAALNNSTIANPIASPLISTKYKVAVTSAKGCVNYDSVQLTVAQPITVQLAKELPLCKGSGVQLTASGATTYRWINNTTGLSNTAIANPVATPTATTTYTVVGYDVYGCFTDSASVRVTVYNLPAISAGPDVEIQGGVPYQLSAVSGPDVVKWLWTPAENLSCSNCATPLATPKKQTTFIVKATTAQGCSAMDTVLIKLQCAAAHVHIPDAFTPNGDGNNDVFYIRGSGVNMINYIRIFNRDGTLVFERTGFGVDERSSAWDGRYKGQPVGTGTYVYVTEMECASGEPFIMKGTVIVIK